MGLGLRWPLASVALWSAVTGQSLLTYSTPIPVTVLFGLLIHGNDEMRFKIFTCFISRL
jgi:hypothetical protein